MVDLTTLTAGSAQLVLAPALGGGIARLDVGNLPVLRPWQGDCDNAFSLAGNVLVPFSNRISGGGFDWNGVHHALASNLPGETFPIHGDGFQKPWSVDQCDQSATLRLTDGSFGPWRYTARQVFDLTETSLAIALSVINTGPDALPFGCGFHPWFPRSSATRLSFDSHAVWMEDERYLPTEERPLDSEPDWSFSTPRALPGTWINNGYTGWTGTARIEQGPEAVSCVVSACDTLSTALVFSPDASSDFFCFEPVSHPVDAFHQPGNPGLHELASGGELSVRMQISWSDQ